MQEIFEKNVDDILNKSVAVQAKDLKLKSRKVIHVNGYPIGLSTTATNDLIKLLGLTDKVASSLDIIMQDGQVMDGLMNMLIEGLGKTNTEFMLVFDVHKCVQRICSHEDFKKLTSRVAQGTMQTIVEGLLTEYPDLQLIDVHTTNGGTTTSFNLIDTRSIDIGIKGEDINFGKQIVWDFIDPTTCSDFINRMVCMNGMVREITQNKQYLTNQTPSTTWFKEIYESLVNGTEGKVKSYRDNVLRASTSNLSVREWFKANEILSDRFRGTEASNKIMQVLGDGNDWKVDYANAGLKLGSLTQAQLSNCPTPINAWDTVNLMTNLATHEPGKGRAKNTTMRDANKWLSSPWDSNGHIFNTPRYKSEKDLVLTDAWIA